MAMSKAPDLKLKPGDKAPDFVATTQNGDRISLSDFKGRQVVLYFYPRDDTPGCTKEACAFRDEFAALKKKGVEKYKLPFTLLADEDKKLVQAYGAWGQKSFMGRKYMGTFRVTFLIGPDGRIKQVWPLVKPAEHAAEVLKALG
jgi:peroxiredoxin Q/BCP